MAALIEGMENWDSYGLEADLFERDVHLLILATLRASEETLAEQVDTVIRDLKAAIEKYGGSPRLDDDYVDCLSTHSDQIRFLHNNALVALTSRTFIAVQNMANAARFEARKAPNTYTSGSFGPKGEWALLLNQLEARFQIDFKVEPGLTDFIRPMVEARNRIVHHGGQPYPMTSDLAFDMTLAPIISEYVRGEGMSAEIDVSEEILERNVDSCLRLANFIAKRLRQLELAAARNDAGNIQ